MDSGRVTANGIDYYYEVHGEGEQTHYDVFASAALVPTVLPFLNGETHGASGAEEARRAA